jgi:3-oxoacyl-[acyl-carrier protein] reductase
LLPGAFDTDRLRSNMAGAAQKTGQSADAVAEARRKTIPAQRFGTPEEFGAICAFLCSTHAAYMTGQNVLADGGAYPGTY